MNVLLAEDDEVTRENLTTILQAEGYRVHGARNGGEALAQWNDKAADIVLLDIMMPDKSGYDVCREIRSEDPAVPVMFISAKSEEVDVVVGLELGADDFLRKPFGKHEFLARVRALTRRKNIDRPGGRFPFGPWTIWLLELRATHEDQSVELTPREVRILELLKAREGKVVTRDELLNECWGIDYFPESRTLDQHVSNLRKKLKNSPIKTVRGTGYQMA
ncbi:MAG: response regulator transcription factor [Verrucomicrobiota bacterium]